jgi:hypothetical protein
MLVLTGTSTSHILPPWLTRSFRSVLCEKSTFSSFKSVV